MQTLVQLLHELNGAMAPQKRHGGPRPPSPLNEAIIEWMKRRAAPAEMASILEAFQGHDRTTVTHAVYYLARTGRLVNDVPVGGKRVARYRLP